MAEIKWAALRPLSESHLKRKRVYFSIFVIVFLVMVVWAGLTDRYPNHTFVAEISAKSANRNELPLISDSPVLEYRYGYRRKERTLNYKLYLYRDGTLILKDMAGKKWFKYFTTLSGEDMESIHELLKTAKQSGLEPFYSTGRAIFTSEFHELSTDSFMGQDYKAVYANHVLHEPVQDIVDRLLEFGETKKWERIW